MTTLTAGTRTDELARVADQIRHEESILTAIRLAPRLSDLAAQTSQATTVLEELIDDRSDMLSTYLAIDALGRVPSAQATSRLIELLQDPDPATRHHSAWALSHRRPAPEGVHALLALAEDGGFATMMADLALEAWISEVPEITWLLDSKVAARLRQSRPSISRPLATRPRGGLRVAQILIQGKVDADLTSAAGGDGGGLITLQVGLTSELTKLSSISEAHLVTRGFTDHGRSYAEDQAIGDGGFIDRVTFGPDRYVSRNEMWEHRAELERGLEELLASKGPFDVMHLRFADVGTFAAARVARRFDIPVVFTLAPDPHSVIDAAQRDGTLTRANFASAEDSEHYLFRAWLINHLVDEADHLALLPRTGLRDRFLELLDVDVSSGSRFTVVPEGVDLGQIDSALKTVGQSSSDDQPAVVKDLIEGIRAMPADRQGLPVILTVGRLSTVKGIDRLVAAWATDSAINSAFNLVIVGGDLERPSDEERLVIDAIHRAAGSTEPDGVLMLGGRSHKEVAAVMAAVRTGITDVVGSDGIYVSASAKEEFGLAIVEALGAGLPVVAPAEGGPATYVRHQFTGYVTDTLDVSAIQRGIRWAIGARRSQVRADAARRMVRNEYSLSAMAASLADLYRPAQRRNTAS